MDHDIVIIGGGPAGLTAGIYAARAGLKAVVLEKEPMGTGQIAVTERVDNYPGLYGVSGYDLGEKFRQQCARLGTEVRDSEVAALKPADEGGFCTTLKNGQVITSKTVIYAAGTSYRRLEVKGCDLVGISHCATCDGVFYRDKTVAVIGGGDTALTDAVYLSRTAKRVMVVHRRDTLRAEFALAEKARAIDNIEFLLEARLLEILGEGRVNGIKISQRGEEKTIPVEGIFVAIGSIPNTFMLEGLVELDSNGYIKADEEGVTSLRGFFAAGDVRTKALRQVVTAVSDGASCVNSAERYINSRE